MGFMHTFHDRMHQVLVRDLKSQGHARPATPDPDPPSVPFPMNDDRNGSGVAPISEGLRLPSAAGAGTDVGGPASVPVDPSRFEDLIREQTELLNDAVARLNSIRSWHRWWAQGGGDGDTAQWAMDRIIDILNSNQYGGKATEFGP